METRASDGGLGLFATKSYQEGDLILEELPLTKLSPTKDEQEALCAKFVGSGEAKDDDPTLLERIEVPSGISGDEKGIFKGMVQTALCFESRDMKGSEKNILDLYAPDPANPNEAETMLVKTAQEALAFIKKIDIGEIDDEVMLKIMLVYACNAFEEGRIYKTISRLNHSCTPTAVVVPDGEAQKIIAARSIADGEEVTISYLDLLLYSDTETRRKQLRRTKYFDCKCKRCLAKDDLASSVPCPSCHPRSGRQLDEEVQYDDEQGVKYAFKVDGTYTCSACGKTINKDASLVKTIERVQERVTSFILERNDEEEDSEGILEEHISLASSILGAKHWTTNLLLLLQLTQNLQSFHSELVESDKDPDMTTIAEFVDSLQRIVRFVDGLDLGIHRGHLLSDVIIGVARSLVALGDTKSQKYAAEWLEPLMDYVKKFETEGIQKVTQSLLSAWKREPQSKRQKLN